MGKGGASSTWEGVQSLPGHGDGLGGRQQHIRLVPAEGDEGHLVPTGVRLSQESHGSALRSKVAAVFVVMSAQHGRMISTQLTNGGTQ